MGALGLQPGCMLSGVWRQRAAVWSSVPYRSCTVGQLAAIAGGVALSLTVTCHIAVCVQETWSHLWTIKAKWCRVGEPLLTPCLQHRETNRSDHSCVVSES